MDQDGKDLNTELSQVFSQLQLIDSDKAPARAAVVLAGLGLNQEMQAAATRTFSGGWRMIISLFSCPDLLLLDELTNILDMQAVLWLVRYLHCWAGTILVVSHDRNFLDAVRQML